MVTTKFTNGEMDCVVLDESELEFPEWSIGDIDYFTIKPIAPIPNT